MKTNVKLAQALVNLRVNADFGTVLEAITEYEGEEMKRCISARDVVDIHRAQGATAALATIKKLYADAPADLDKFSHQRK